MRHISHTTYEHTHSQDKEKKKINKKSKRTCEKGQQAYAEAGEMHAYNMITITRSRVITL